MIVKKKSSLKGMTLIELLAMVAVISIMSGFLFGAYNKSRSMGHRVVCISNLKNMGQAMQLYAEDYRLRFPPKANWHTLLHEDYLESDTDVFVCPAASDLTFGTNMGYGINTDIDVRYIPDFNMRKIVTITEITGGIETSGNTIATRHAGGANAVYGDGSIEWHLDEWYTEDNLINNAAYK